MHKNFVSVGVLNPYSLWSWQSAENSIPSASCLLPSAFLDKSLENQKMPKKTTPKMIQIAVSIPEPLYEAAKRIQAMEGWNESEMHRLFWEKGFALHVQGTLARHQLGLIPEVESTVE